MSKPNYKSLATYKFRELLEATNFKTQNPELEDYTFGQVLYSVLRKNFLPNKPEDASTRWLMSITDEEFYQSIEKAQKEEIIEITQ